MAQVSVRKQGGAAIMTIPAEVARELGIAVGATLDVVAADGRLVAKPTAPIRKRYTLEELMRGCTRQGIADLAEETAWARDGEPVGREI